MSPRRAPSARVAVAARPTAALVPLLAALWAAFALATVVGMAVR